MEIYMFKEQTASCIYRASSSYSGLAADICMSSVNRLQEKSDVTSNSCSSNRRRPLQERLNFVEREVEAYPESVRSENVGSITSPVFGPLKIALIFRKHDLAMQSASTSCFESVAIYNALLDPEL